MFQSPKISIQRQIFSSSFTNRVSHSGRHGDGGWGVGWEGVHSYPMIFFETPPPPPSKPMAPYGVLSPLKNEASPIWKSNSPQWKVKPPSRKWFLEKNPEKSETVINTCVLIIKQPWKKTAQIPQEHDFLTWSIQNSVNGIILQFSTVF